MFIYLIVQICHDNTGKLFLLPLEYRKCDTLSHPIMYTYCRATSATTESQTEQCFNILLDHACNYTFKLVREKAGLIRERLVPIPLKRSIGKCLDWVT